MIVASVTVNHMQIHNATVTNSGLPDLLFNKVLSSTSQIIMAIRNRFSTRWICQTRLRWTQLYEAIKLTANSVFVRAVVADRIVIRLHRER